MNKQLFSEAAMQHSTVMEHFNDELGYGVSSLIKLITILQGSSIAKRLLLQETCLGSVPMHVGCQNTRYEARMLGTEPKDAVNLLPSSIKLRQLCMSASDQHPRPWQAACFLQGVKDSCRRLIRHQTKLGSGRGSLRLRSRLWLHKIVQNF
jgi:hypothetical protein